MDAKRKLIGLTALGAALAAIVARVRKRGGEGTEAVPGAAEAQEEVHDDSPEPDTRLEVVPLVKAL